MNSVRKLAIESHFLQSVLEQLENTSYEIIFSRLSQLLRQYLKTAHILGLYPEHQTPILTAVGIISGQVDYC